MRLSVNSLGTIDYNKLTLYNKSIDRDLLPWLIKVRIKE